MFENVKELVEQAESSDKKIYELMIEQEVSNSDKTEEQIIAQMHNNFSVMKNAAKKGIEGVKSISGLTGYDAKKIYEYITNGKFITDKTFLLSICYAVAVNEVNASMGIVCANPTAGSCGVLPGVMLSVQEKFDISDDIIVKHLFTAGAFGYIIANNASISGAAGGCQAEVGSASAMAAASVTELLGGTPKQCANAMAIAMKNMLGLVCDPVAGLVEVPCIKRNAAEASNAITSAEMALAGVESVIPWDEVIWAMNQIGISMPVSLRETAMGGLAATKTGAMYLEKLNTM